MKLRMRIEIFAATMTASPNETMREKQRYLKLRAVFFPTLWTIQICLCK